MADRRAQTLEALSVFIESQRHLLSRTVLDIERLKILRNHSFEEPISSFETLSDQLKEPTFRLSEQLDCTPRVPRGIDWSIYATCDPTAFRTLAATLRLDQTRRREPPTTQQSDLSDLQKFVKNSRKIIADPVLAQCISEDDSSSDEDENPTAVRKRMEMEKIRELKRRKTAGCCFTIRTGDIFVRRDQDESADVDISDADPMEFDAPVSPASNRSPSKPPEIPKAARPRRLTKRPTADPVLSHTPTRKKKTDRVSLKPEADFPPTVLSDQKKGKRASKPKPETYKQAWTLSEQHLLEKLLEEIPDGEKNRWVKISQAMNGRRTARQVASRVQKYFEKLKQFGVGVNVGAALAE